MAGLALGTKLMALFMLPALCLWLVMLAWKRGWKVLYQPRSVVYHEHRGTIGRTFSENRIQAVVYQVQSVGEQVKIEGHLHVVADDPDDDKFVECAIVAGASLIVSSDRHLLDLKEYRDIHVVTPAAFVERMSQFE